MGGLATVCILCGTAFGADHARIVAGRWWLCEACYAIANRDDDQPTTESRDGEKGRAGSES